MTRAPASVYRRIAVQFPERAAKPDISPVLAAESVLGKRLNPQKANRAIGLVDRKGLLPVRSMPAGALGDDELLDLLLAQPGLSQPFEGQQGKAVPHRRS